MEVTGWTIALITGLSLIMGVLLFLLICCLRRQRMWTKQKLKLAKELNECCEDISVYENDPPSAGENDPPSTSENDPPSTGENDPPSTGSDRKFQRSNQTGTGRDRKDHVTYQLSMGMGNTVYDRVNTESDEKETDIHYKDNIHVTVEFHDKETEDTVDIDHTSIKDQGKESNYKIMNNYQHETCNNEENKDLIPENDPYKCSFTDSDAGSDSVEC